MSGFAGACRYAGNANAARVYFFDEFRTAGVFDNDAYVSGNARFQIFWSGESDIRVAQKFVDQQFLQTLQSLRLGSHLSIANFCSLTKSDNVSDVFGSR